MAELSSPPIPQRKVGGSGTTLSLIGLTVVPPSVPGPSADQGVIERLRRARAAGVTTFDIAGSPQPAQAERLLGEAFVDPDPDLVLIVGRRLEDLVRPGDTRPSAPRAPDAVPERFRLSLEDSDRRLAPNWVGIVDWTDTDVPPALQRDWDRQRRADVPPPLFCHRFPAGRPVAGSGGPDQVPSRMFSGSLSLLDARLAAFVEPQAAQGPVSFLARDPFAGGRLDGTRAAASAVERGPGAGPIRLRELESEFAPVLRLAFLTQDRTRTMAQAAIRYVAHWDWVGSILVPLPSVDRLGEVLGTFGTPALSDEEIRQIPRDTDTG